MVRLGENISILLGNWDDLLVTKLDWISQMLPEVIISF